MRTLYRLIPLVVSLILATAAHAATVKVVEPDVYIGGADGYKAVPGTAQAHVGDSVMAGEYGVGQIIYENGCVITVRPGTVVVVEAGSPGSCEAADLSSSGAEGSSAGYYLLGAAVVGGIVVGVVALSGGDSDKKPASP